MKNTYPPQSKGFTLLELLIISIIVVLGSSLRLALGSVAGVAVDVGVGLAELG